MGDVHYYVVNHVHARKLLKLKRVETPSSANSEKRQKKVKKQILSRINDIKKSPFLTEPASTELKDIKAKDEHSELRRSSFDDAYSEKLAPVRIISAIRSYLEPETNMRAGISLAQVIQRHRQVRSIAFSNQKDHMTITDWLLDIIQGQVS